MENTKEKGIFVRIYNWFKNLTVKGLLGAILVAFIIIIILMSASYIPNIVSRVSNSLSAALYSIFVPAENATMTTSKMIVNSGEDFNITFKKGDMTNGIFTITYACDAKASLLSVETNGLKVIDCGTPYYLLDNETSIKIKPTTEDSVVRLVIDGAFENNDTQKIETVGVVRLTVKNDLARTIVTPPVNPATTTNVIPPFIPSQPAPIQPIYYGKPDLAIRVLQIGIINNGTNIVTNQNQFSSNNMVGIKFEVRNDGDANTGLWSFTATLPSISNPIYNSNTQISLRPGDSIIYTLGFSNLTNQYTSQITIRVDPLNIISESNEYNNTLTSTITNISYNSNYYNNNYNSGCYINGVYSYNCNNYNYNNGCYVNGVFTYNCNNYNYNNLQVYCYADPSDPETGDRVRWYADVTGGDGDYDYDWTGTNSLDSSSRNPTKTYSSSGTKRATVTVTDGDDNEASATCTIYVD